MPAVFTDNFTGTAGTALNGRTASGGGTWTTTGATGTDQAALKINVANQVKVSSTTGCLASFDTGVPDHYARASLLATGISVAVAVRASGYLNLIGLRIANSTTIELFKRVSGAETSLYRPTLAAISLPAILELRAVGQYAFPYLNGTLVGPAIGTLVSDAAFAGVTRAGLWGKTPTTDPIADDFEAGTLSVPLAPAFARGTMRDPGGVIALWLALAPASGLSFSRSAGAGVTAPFAIGPAGARHAVRTGALSLAGPARLISTAARQPLRDNGALLNVRALLACEGGRSPARGSAGWVARFPVGIRTPVDAEVRQASVLRD